ncbi:lipoate--protein ligase [Sporosalibacterium faouarense]|uniref:lipoate--protein ligase n=1 Tax=Sporosalibacterium faouarense TaxID=516123 RepID=UPI00192BF78C|nr:lipoate--protein ligase [Sporosalibacterium faouarense]
MISIKNNAKDPHFNLALEEYALKHLELDDDIIILWQNEPSVIIGRNQNTIEEINYSYINENNINVVRRLSGGGAVYHDLGNLNFTFITKNKKDNVSNFKKFTEPVINALNKLGVKAEFTGRNDITIDGKKFSGNAQYYYRDKLLHHGTILFNSDLSVVKDALNVKIDKIESKGIKSVRSRVTNVYPYLKEKVSIDKFKDYLLKSMIADSKTEESQYVLTDKDMKKINEMMESRYLTWEWNYGESPDFDIQKAKRFEGGNIDIRLNVKNGIISDCKIFGDFFGNRDKGELENLLINKRYEENSIKDELNSIAFEEYIFKINIDDFINCMFY